MAMKAEQWTFDGTLSGCCAVGVSWRVIVSLLAAFWAGGVWAVVAPAWPLNDTGIDWWADGSRNILRTSPAGYPGQDASRGRDSTQDQDSDGHAGFSFTKLDANGNAMSSGASSWSCVRDNVTGLIWEVKTNDGGLRDRDWSYSWHNPAPASNGGSAGYPNGGACGGAIACDTLGYTQAVNRTGLCGAGDWRLPSRQELLSIVDRNGSGLTIDTNYFADLGPTLRYWSSSPNAANADLAGVVLFSGGSAGGDYKSNANPVRLVRGGQALPGVGTVCTSALNQSQQTQGAAGGSGTVAVVTPAGCAWQAVSNASWIQVSTQSGTGNGDVNYTVGANTLTTGRLGTLTIAGRSLTVSQEGAAAVIEGPAELSGVVRDAATGLPLDGATVQLGAGQTVSAAATGVYSFTGVTAGDYTLTVSKTGYRSSTQSVTLAPLASSNHNPSLTKVSTKVKVSDITSKYEKRYYFLAGMNHPVDFSTQVDWGGDAPVSVKLITDNNVYTETIASDQLTVQLNAGTEFYACGGLKAKAVSQTEDSPLLSADFGVMSNPFGSMLDPWDRTEEGHTFSYKPIGAPDMDFFNTDEKEAITVPDWIPLFGGKPMKLDWYPRVEVELQSDGTVHGRLELALDTLRKDWPLGGKPNAKKLTAALVKYMDKGTFNRKAIPKQYLAGAEFSIFPFLQLEGRYSDTTCSWGWNGSSLGLAGDGSAKVTRQMVTMVAAVPVPWYIKASISALIQGELGVIGMVNTAARLTGEVTLETEARGAIGAGVDSVIAIEGWISGGLKAAWVFDGRSKPRVLDLTLAVGRRAYVLMYSYDAAPWNWSCDLVAHDCHGPGLDSAADVRGASLAAVPTKAAVVTRDYLRAPGYGAFPAGAMPVQRAAASSGVVGGTAALDATQTAAVQAVVFPQSQVTLAAAGNQLQGAWLYDEPARSAINRSAAVFSAWQGAAWGPFAPIADDGTADFHPRMLTFGDGATVAVWEDVKGVLADTAPFEEMAAALEISVGMRDAQTGQWQSRRLTDNAYLDRSPRVAGVPGDLWVLWIANAANQVRGTAAAPNVLKASHWDGSAWGAPQDLATFGEGLVRYDLAYNGSAGAVALSLDTDGDSATVDDQEIFAINLVGGTWGTLQRLTNDAVVDANPKLAFDSQGAPRLVWLRGGSLVDAPLSDLGQARSLYASEYSTNLADFQLAAAADGRLMVVWAEPGEFSSDLKAIFYDLQGDLWASPAR